MISISIVEDHPEYRQALTELLESDGQFNILGSYATAEIALKGLIKSQPDIAIIDIQMPGMSGIELIDKTKQVLQNTQYLICTSHFDNEIVFKALEVGASGYLLKDADRDAIIKAIIELHNGGSPMSPYIARKVIARLQKSKFNADMYGLTNREEEVLQKLARGLLYKEIADQMNLSILTVKSHVKNIYRKLHVQNRIEALNKYNG